MSTLPYTAPILINSCANSLNPHFSIRQNGVKSLAEAIAAMSQSLDLTV